VSDTGDLEKGGGTLYKIDQSDKVTQAWRNAEQSYLQNPNGLLVEGKNRLLVTDLCRVSYIGSRLPARKPARSPKDWAEQTGL
jgi:hypothetical protein